MPPDDSRGHPPDPPDDEIVARLRAGDVEAFRQLFLTLHAGLCACAERVIGDEARAQELVQDLFLDLWRKRDALTLTGSVRGYLYAAVRNRALNVRRRDHVERDWADDEALDDVRALHQSPTAADASIEAREQRAALAAALATLPERCRQAMHLRWQHGLSYAEVAEVLGIGVKAVEKQLARGLRLLRDALGP